LSIADAFSRYVARYPALAALLYAAIVSTLAVASWSALSDIYDRHVTLAAASDMLARIEGHGKASSAAASSPGSPSDSPFLQGPTVTVAGAALQQRVTDAVTKLGGSVLSSQVDLQGAQAKEGFVTLTTSCEVDQPALQRLLYDLESGMPFLFVDQLVVQAAQPGAGRDEARMRLLLSISGQWQHPN
jgi:general secretion pathway protein M